MIVLDLSSTEAVFRRPEILQHPQIPGPLAGMNPRSLFGATWWDDTRRRAYRINHYHCHACGGSPDDDEFRGKLDAHECYTIDWKLCQATYVETVALCYSCHHFIHAGRFRALTEDGTKKLKTLRTILSRGVDILQEADLLPFWRTYVIYLEYVKGLTPRSAITKARSLNIVDPYSTIHAAGNKWTLVVYGVTYRRDDNGKVRPETSDMPPLWRNG